MSPKGKDIEGGEKVGVGEGREGEVRKVRGIDRFIID